MKLKCFGFAVFIGSENKTNPKYALDLQSQSLAIESKMRK